VTELPLTRLEAGRLAAAAKRASGLSWADIAAKLGRSPVWATSAVLGQQPLDAAQAATLGELLDLPPDVVTALQLPPARGVDAVDLTDPLVYRLHEMVQVYGSSLRELVTEEFGDGIVSAIDFEIGLERVADPKGDRAVITLNGKFLPYRVF
jgi:cyanate lyase